MYCTCMATLTRRTQILFDEETYRALEENAAEQGRPVAALVRDAVAAAYPTRPSRRAQAVREFLRAGDRDPLPVADWPDMKREIRDSLVGIDRHLDR